MKRYLNILLLAFLMWAIPYAASLLFFPLMQTDIHYFKTIMIVIGMLTWCGLSYYYFIEKQNRFLVDGILIGIFGFGLGILLDIVGVLSFNKEMTFVTYLKEIGFRYLAIPINSILLGLLLEKKVIKMEVKK